MEIAVVLPTNRDITHFLESWDVQFVKHDVHLVIVRDGETPQIECDRSFAYDPTLIPKKCAGVRNMGFQYVAERLPEVEYIITLDDDTTPDGDTIGDHVETLNKRLPISFFSHTGEAYMRGFPYGIRSEAPVMFSHGVWQGNADWDAPTQLLNNNALHTEFYKGAIPKGALAPLCGMNIGFRREALPYVYFAPVNEFKGAERFDDIWMGFELKRDFDELGWAVATGYASINHERASNVFHNLEKEAVGIRYNEDYWNADHPWFAEFKRKRKLWKDHMKHYV